ncbi:MAG: hypothetical protein HQL99_15415 [Magnetococcales bacterium]|nr:hypothetical protein [Magnetococcales bacterium]
MNIKELQKLAIDNLVDNDGKLSSRMVLKGKFPAGFPRGLILEERPNGQGSVRQFDPIKVLEWVRKHQWDESPIHWFDQIKR